MVENVVLGPEEKRFIEEMGVHFASHGVPLIGGRLLALLLLAPRPLTLDEIAGLLVVSRASVSTNSRLFIQVGIVEPWTLPGDRRRHYVFAPNAWEHRLHAGRASAAALRRMVQSAQAAVSPDNEVAREKLRVAGAFAEFLEGASADMMSRWRALHLQMEASR